MNEKCAKFPAEVTAGLDFKAMVYSQAHPAPTWTVTAILRGPASIDLSAASDLDLHTFEVDAADTASWAPGAYAYSVRAASGASVVELDKGQLRVLADLATQTGAYDPRTENEKALEAINAVLSQRASLDQQRYKINNRELWRTPINDLLKLKSFYDSAVRRERGKGGFGRQIPVRFS